MAISFNDLDDIIEINEKRFEQYSNAYQKNLDKFTNILIIYSAITVFLVPIIQDLFFEHKGSLINFIFFGLFSLLFIYSLVFTIRLLIPIEIAYLIEPKEYYTKFRLDYKAEGRSDQETDQLVKASYIDELEKAVTRNNYVFKRKGNFYYRALISALISGIPFLICVALNFNNKSENIQKIEIVNPNKKTTFIESRNMSDSNNTTTGNSSGSNTNPPPTTSQLPGINPSDVKPSNPQMIKESFEITSNKSDTSKGKN